MAKISGKIFEEMKSSLLMGRYNLLLGAGVSLDSKNGSGDRLVSGGELLGILCKHKGARASSSIQRVFDTLSDDEKIDLVLHRFESCAPGPTVSAISKFYWRRIFTFNIDDALEAAYEQKTSGQTIKSHHFLDDYQEYHNSSDLLIAHLHGWTRQWDRGVVFSRNEYARFIKSVNPWMHVLSQFIPNEPFIIAGTALDEVDLEYYLSLRSEKTIRGDVGPSILVEPFPDAVTHADCKKYGLQLYEGTFLEFLAELEELAPVRQVPGISSIKGIEDNLSQSVSARDLASFGADFEVAPYAQKEPAPNLVLDVSFLYGHEATWKSLQQGQDIERATTAEISYRIQSFLDSPQNEAELILLEDIAGGGKSTILKRIAFNFSSNGVLVLNCRTLHRIDPERFCFIVEKLRIPALIVIDNIADHALSIAGILEKCSDKKILILGAERTYRFEYIRKVLRGLRFLTVSGKQMEASDASRLIEKYYETGLLGNPDIRKNRNKFITKIQADPIAVAACRALNDFSPLDRIIESLKNHSSQSEIFAYLVASIASYSYKPGIRYSVLSAILETSSLSRQFSHIHSLPLTYFDTDKEFCCPLNATISHRMLEGYRASDQELLYEVTSRIAQQIAPYVNRKAIQNRSPEARLAGRLFDYDTIVNYFIPNYALRFYAEQQSAWQWNSRYWGQRALALLDVHRNTRKQDEMSPELRDAIQYARHGVVRERHQLPLTTLGTVLLAQLPITSLSSETVFRDAFEKLSAAIEMEIRLRRISIQPIIALFRGSHAFLSRGHALSAWQHQMLSRYMSDAETEFRDDREIIGLVDDLRAMMTT